MDNIGGGAAKSGALVASDVLILLGFIAAVVGILVLTVYLAMQLRKNRKSELDRQIRGEHLPARQSASGRNGSDEEGQGSEPGRSSRRRVRRRRRDHRPRNPSLAESGGLPPVRPEDSVPPI